MIVLHNPRSLTRGKRRLPLSLLSLSRMMPGRCVISDGNVDPDPIDRMQRLTQTRDSEQKKQPLIVAMTVMVGPQLRQAVDDTQAVKRWKPDALIVWGGYFPTLYPDVCLASGLVDYVVRGQGELSFSQLVDSIQRGTSPSTIRGISFRQNGTLHHNPAAQLRDVNALPPYDFSQVDAARYVIPTYLGTRTLSYVSSAGCYANCSFCAINQGFEWRWMGERAQRTLEAVRCFKQRYDINALEFFDAHFFVSEPRTVDIAAGMKRLGVRWWGESRIDTLLGYSDHSWRIIRESGCHMIFFGAESGSDTTLNVMDKEFGTEQIVELTRRCKEHGIIPELSFVVGCPPEPRREIEETIRFIRKIKTLYEETEILIFLYTPVPQYGTPLFDKALESGFKYPKTLQEWASGRWTEFGTHKRPHTPWLSKSSWRRVRDFEIVVHARFPTLTDLRMGRWSRAALRGLSWWRYRYGLFRWPYELKLLMRLVQYQSPEVEGF